MDGLGMLETVVFDSLSTVVEVERRLSGILKSHERESVESALTNLT